MAAVVKMRRILMEMVLAGGFVWGHPATRKNIYYIVLYELAGRGPTIPRLDTLYSMTRRIRG